MLTYAQMQALSSDIAARLIGARFLRMRQAGDKKWIMDFVKDTEKYELLFSAHYPFNRFHLSTQALPVIQTHFTGEVQMLLQHAVLMQMQLLGEDRILCLQFQKAGKEVCFVIELCIRHPKVIVMDEHWKILASHAAISDPIYRLPEQKRVHAPETALYTSCEIETLYSKLEEAAAWDERVQRVGKAIQLKLKRARRSLDGQREEAKLAAMWQEEMHRADLLKSQFFRLKRGMKEIVIEDWEQDAKPVVIPLDPTLDPQELLKQRFKLCKKLKRRHELSAELIQEAEKQVCLWEKYLEQLSDHKVLEQLEAMTGLRPAQKKEKPGIKAHPFREFTTESGAKIFVGKKDVDNDRLTFTFANGSDLWLHAANTPGSHVILKMPKGKEVDEGALQDALQLALYFSKARTRQEDEVVYTECKYIAKVKRGKPGQVTLSHHQTVWVRSDPTRLKRLLNKK